MSSPTTSYYYYFYPLTQTYSLNSDYKSPSVSIRIEASEELDGDKLTKCIHAVGNSLTLLALKNISSNTKGNYCDDYSAHEGTCAQTRMQFCKRHLTKEEMDECEKMDQSLLPVILKGYKWKAEAFTLARGDIDTMRRILVAVRQAINPT